MFNFDRIDRQMKNFHGMVGRLGVDPVDLATDCLGYRLTSALRRCGVPYVARPGGRQNRERPGVLPQRGYFRPRPP